MSSERTRPVYVFFSYARQDKALRDKLEDHLSNLKYRGLISTWHDREISAGTEWIQQIDIHLDTADIILLLISSSFMASQYCYSIEMKRALERHEMREARVIPIMLKPVLFTNAPFAKLQFLPTNGKPVVNWRNRDRAFVDIALGIEDVVQGHFASTIEEKLLQLATGSIRLDLLAGAAFKRWRKQTYYKRALAAYEQALHSNPSDVTAYRGKGNALVGATFLKAIEIISQRRIEKPMNERLNLTPFSHLLMLK